MARIKPIIKEWDDDEWIVERDNGSCYKSFTNYDQANAYYQYLQQLDNQEIMLTQNQQIINNQNALLDYQKSSRNIPHFFQTKPIYNPEYEEWLRYKKATDTKYKEWKREEERKKEIEKREQEEKNRIWREREERQEIKNSLQQFKHDLKQLTDSLNAYTKWVPIIKKIMSFGLDSVNYLHNAGNHRCPYTKNSYTVELINERFLSYEDKSIAFYKQLQSLDKYVEDLSTSCTKEDLINMKNYYYSCKRILDEYNRKFHNIRNSVVYVYEYLFIIKTNFINATDWRKFGLLGWEGRIRRASKSYLKKYHDLYDIMKQYGVEIFDGCETIYRNTNKRSLFYNINEDHRDKDTGDEDRFFNYSYVIKPLS